MKAYKGFTEDLWSRLGDGEKENCSFTIGETKEVPESKTARNGFHCCENPFDCLAYYSMDGKNRFFEVLAEGDIDEDESNRIACTKLTLVKELSPAAFALAGMRYMVTHPDRKGWEKRSGSVNVRKDEAEAGRKGHIAIARGSSPRVKGPEGSILGLIVEDESGIRDAKMLVVPEELAGKWLTINEKREVKTIEEEKD